MDSLAGVFEAEVNWLFNIVTYYRFRKPSIVRSISIKVLEKGVSIGVLIPQPRTWTCY